MSYIQWLIRGLRHENKRPGETDRAKDRQMQAERQMEFSVSYAMLAPLVILVISLSVRYCYSNIMPVLLWAR